MYIHTKLTLKNTVDWTLEYHRAEELRRGVKGVQISTAKLLRLTMGLDKNWRIIFCVRLFVSVDAKR